jgi:hypothetical protein
MQGTEPDRAQAVQSTVEHRYGGGDAADVPGSAPGIPVQVVDPGPDEGVCPRAVLWYEYGP